MSHVVHKEHDIFPCSLIAHLLIKKKAGVIKKFEDKPIQLVSLQLPSKEWWRKEKIGCLPMLWRGR